MPNQNTLLANFGAESWLTLSSQTGHVQIISKDEIVETFKPSKLLQLE